MKLVRYGEAGKEKPGILDAQGGIRDLSGVVKDIDGSVVTLIPLNTSGTPATVPADMGTAVRAWVCGGTGTTANLKYLPGTCRGN